MYTHILYNTNYWKRFIDHIFLIWPHGMDSLLEFINHLNTVHSPVKFTKDISPPEISFLDLTIYIKGSTLHTRLHTETTDRHMYLNFSSGHHMSLKNEYHIHNSLKEYILNPSIYWRHKYICISQSGGNIPMILYYTG